MEFLDIVYFLLLGIATGILSGLLGFGGGVFLVPCLYFIFQHLPFPPERVMHIAIGTSLAAMIATAFASTWSHQKKRAVVWSVSKKMIPGLFLGSILGAIVARYLSTGFLAEFFGIFALLLSFYLLLPVKKEISLPVTSSLALNFSGGGIGVLSSLLGIGGGTIAVPLLIAFRMPIKNAIATSSSLTVITSLIGTVMYLFIGWGKSFPDSFGFIYLPAFLTISLATVLTAPIGVSLAHILPAKILKILYSASLICVALFMIFS